ncbi:hypothetical protein TKK_0004697 [Trichogramma kaykai]
MSRTKNKRSQKRHDKPGRPSKKQRAFNGGRKRLDIFDNIENVSEKTLYRRAEEFAAQRNNNVKFIELALKIARKKNGCDDSATIIETNENEKYDGDSALSFSLDLDLSVHQYRASSGHVSPHQQGDDQIEEFTSQAYLFVSCMNIIQMSCNLHGHDHCWVNPSPQSIRFTRPLRMSFEKEDDEAITKEIRRLNLEISELKIYRFKVNNKTARVKYNVFQTLFDGKCVNSLVDNPATTRCPMCLKTSHQFGNVNEDFTPREESLLFGWSLLHAEIKAFEHLLHLSYRLHLGQWDVRADMKDAFKLRKRSIQEKIFEKIGVKVDLCLQGHGTTNTGNVARRCFENPLLFSECLEIDSELVINLAEIIVCFKSKKVLDLDKLEQLCFKTNWHHYSTYKWARMNPSTHKLLLHGCQISRKFLLPIAYFSEDSSEAWQKLNRSNMRNASRQNSRSNRILDVFNKAIYLSDPKLSLIHVNKRMKFHKSRKIEEFLLSNNSSQVIEEMDTD